MTFRSTIHLLTISPALPPAITNELIRAVVTHVYFFVTDVDFRLATTDFICKAFKLDTQPMLTRVYEFPISMITPFTSFRPPNQLDLEEAMAECLELIFKRPLSPPQLRAVASAIEQSIQLAVVLKTLTLKVRGS